MAVLETVRADISHQRLATLLRDLVHPGWPLPPITGARWAEVSLPAAVADSLRSELDRRRIRHT